jgi:hypothetical protein
VNKFEKQKEILFLTMKKLFLFLILMFYVSNLRAQETGIGAGIMIGEPTGISAKYWLSGENALDAGLAYSLFSQSNGVTLHLDYLFHLSHIYISNQTFLPYYGFGGKVKFPGSRQSSLGARGVAGIAWIYAPKHIDVFLELASIFNLLPATELSLDASLGARYYFTVK